MKSSAYIIFATSVVSTIIAIQFAKAPVSSAKGAVLVIAPTSQPGTIVKIDNFAFEPNELVVPAGTTVTWQNADDVPHTATSQDDPRAFDSGTLDTDDKFSFTFSKPGKFAYYCKVHTHMKGVVVVK
jgi:plastocyanin